LLLWHLNQTFKCLSKKRSQNNLNIHARYHDYNNVEGLNLGVKYCAIDTKYKILKSWNHQNIRNYLQKTSLYVMVLCECGYVHWIFFPLSYILWLNEDGIGIKICCYFGIVVAMLFTSSFVGMFNTKPRMLFDAIVIIT
jgi:hypothetical protein